MRFIQATPTQLIICNSVFNARLGASITILIGLLILCSPVSLTDEHLSSQLRIFGGISTTALGLIGLFTYGRFVTWIFDRADKSLTVCSQFLFVSKTLMYPLAKIDRIQLELKEFADNTIPMFRIFLYLKGEDRLQLCPESNLCEDEAKEAVQLISSFLEL